MKKPSEVTSALRQQGQHNGDMGADPGILLLHGKAVCGFAVVLALQQRCSKRGKNIWHTVQSYSKGSIQT